MAKITLRGIRHLSTTELGHERAEGFTFRPPHVLAGLASGAPVGSSELADDVYRVRAHGAPTPVDRDELDMLSTWILDRTDAGRHDYPDTLTAGERAAVLASYPSGDVTPAVVPDKSGRECREYSLPLSLCLSLSASLPI